MQILASLKTYHSIREVMYEYSCKVSLAQRCSNRPNSWSVNVQFVVMCVVFTFARQPQRTMGEYYNIIERSWCLLCEQDFVYLEFLHLRLIIDELKEIYGTRLTVESLVETSEHDSRRAQRPFELIHQRVEHWVGTVAWELKMEPLIPKVSLF